MNNNIEWLIVNDKYKIYLKLPKIGIWQNDLWKIYKFLNNYFGDNIHFISNEIKDYEEILKDPEYKNYDETYCNLTKFDEEDLDYAGIIQHDILHSAWNFSRLIQLEKDRRYNEILKNKK